MSLVDENIGLVFKTAKALAPRGQDYRDYVTSGYIGLASAASRFDESRGAAFATFAGKRIAGQIREQIRHERAYRSMRRGKNAKTIPIGSLDFSCVQPVNESEHRDQVRRLTSGMDGRQRMACEMLVDGLTHAEIAQAFGVTDSYASKIIRNQVAPILKARLARA